MKNMENKYFVYKFKAENELVTTITGFHAETKEEAKSIFNSILSKIPNEYDIELEDIEKIREDYFNAFYDKKQLEIEIIPIKYMCDIIAQYGNKPFKLEKSGNNVEDKEFAFEYHCAEFKHYHKREFKEVSNFTVYI